MSTGCRRKAEMLNLVRAVREERRADPPTDWAKAVWSRPTPLMGTGVIGHSAPPRRFPLKKKKNKKNHWKRRVGVSGAAHGPRSAGRGPRQKYAVRAPAGRCPTLGHHPRVPSASGPLHQEQVGRPGARDEKALSGRPWTSRQAMVLRQTRSQSPAVQGGLMDPAQRPLPAIAASCIAPPSSSRARGVVSTQREHDPT